MRWLLALLISLSSRRPQAEGISIFRQYFLRGGAGARLGAAPAAALCPITTGPILSSAAAGLSDTAAVRRVCCDAAQASRPPVSSRIRRAIEALYGRLEFKRV